MEQQVNPLMTLRDAARRLGIGYAYAAELARRGIIPSVRLARTVRVDPQQLERWISDGGKALPGGWKRDAA